MITTGEVSKHGFTFVHDLRNELELSKQTLALIKAQIDRIQETL